VANDPTPVVDYTRRHLRLGWWSLLLFATLGLGLESLHGFKVRAYLDVSNETRRLMWTLAHAHGTLLAVLNIVFGLSVRAVPELTAARVPLISRALVGATVHRTTAIRTRPARESRANVEPIDLI